MYCGGCDNIPFWKWLKETQTYPTSITCNDFDGKNSLTYNLTMVLVPLVSTCVLGFESVIKFIAWTLNY